MAVETIELEVANASGELAEIRLGGATDDNLVLKRLDMSNVDNTSDADKPISTATQTALDGKADDASVTALAGRVTVNEADISTNATNIGTNDTDIAALGTGKLDNTVAQFTPQTDPGIGEGQVFYDSGKHALSVISDVDMVLNLGQEEVIRVINNSGAAIPNSKAVYITGAVNGLPAIALAKADAYSTASVPGITTHEIADGDEGFITHAGTLGGNFAGYALDEALFLSDITAGEFTNTPPEIVTKLGIITRADPDGAMLVKIANLVQLPNVIGYLTLGLVPQTITATPTVIVDYYESGSIVSTADKVTGAVGTPSTGVYRITANINVQITPENSTKEVTFDLIDEADAVIATLYETLTKNAESLTITVSSPFNAIAGKAYRMRIASDANIAVANVNQASMDIESINLR